MTPKKNIMIEKMQRDEMVLSAKLNAPSHVTASIAAMLGYDAIWVDLEHIPGDYSQIKEVVLACKAYGCETVVRVARGSYSDLIHPLEMDASAVMVPHVMSVEDAKYVARMTKFHPIGRRAIDGGYADGQYCLLNTADYIKNANENRLTIIQIEDIEAYEQLEEIAQIPGIDMLFFGPADFAHSIGVPTNTADPRVLEAKRRVAEVARKYGKFAGTVGSMANAAERVAMGYQFLNIGAELGMGTVIIAHSIFCISFVVVTVKARVASLDPKLEEAAGDLYASPIQAF